jgi:hypothetical protein
MWGAKPYDEIRIFDGGLNTKKAAVNMEKSQTPDAQWVYYDDAGAIQTMPGYTAFCAVTSIYGIDGLYSFGKSDGTRYLVAWAGGSMYNISGSTAPATAVTVPSAQAVYTAGVRVKWVTVENYAVMFNGQNQPYKYDGSNFVQFGISAPTGTANLYLGSGALSGTYKYGFSAVNLNRQGLTLRECSVGFITTSITAASSNISIRNIPVYPVSAGVDYINIYRNTAGTMGTDISNYWLLTSVTNGVTAYTDSIADTALGLTQPYLDQGPPPIGNHICEYRGRLFVAGVSSYQMRLYFSEQGEAEIFPSTNWIDVGAGDGYPITAIKAYANNIAIHKNDDQGNGSVWILYMPDSSGLSDPSNWYLVKTPAQYSSQGDECVVLFSNLMAYLNKYGFFAFADKDVAVSSADSNIGKMAVDSHSYDIEPDILGLNSSYIKKCTAVVYKNKIYLAVPYGQAQTANNRVYVYDFVRASSQDRTVGAWSYAPNPPINNFAVHGGSLFAGSTNGTVYQMDSGYSADGSAYDSYYWTAPLYGKAEHKDYYKIWRYVDIIVECTGNWTMTVKYTTDFQTESGTPITIDLSQGGSQWGVMTWSTSNWGGSITRKTVRLNLNNVPGKCIQFKFETNAARSWWKVHQLKTYYNLRGMRG